jgi:hypothetical protein
MAKSIWRVWGIGIRAALATPLLMVPLLVWNSGKAAADSECIGDCDRSGAVSVDELMVGVKIELGQAAVAACDVFDDDGSGEVSIGEVVRALRFALVGCPTS